MIYAPRPIICRALCFPFVRVQNRCVAHHSLTTSITTRVWLLCDPVHSLALSHVCNYGSFLAHFSLSLSRFRSLILSVRYTASC